METFLNKTISINGLSWGACVESSSKPKSFRPSPKALDAIKKYRQLHPLKKDSKIINELLESLADQTEIGKKTKQGASPFFRTLVLCRERSRFVSKEFCEKKCQTIIDCPIYSALIEANQHPPLDIEQTKKEE